MDVGGIFHSVGGSKVTERPILFSAPMVNAILEGRKTMTRRIVKGEIGERDGVPTINGQPLRDCPAVLGQCPYGKVGDRLWVRETWRTHSTRHDGIPPRDLRPGYPIIHYDASMKFIAPFLGKGRASIHMPRWASRITLEITGIDVQRLQDIMPCDAKDEGLKCLTKDGGRLYKYGIPDRDGLPGTDDHGWPWHQWRISPVDAFQYLWEQINGKDSWAENPFVWCISFKRIA